MNKIGLTPTFEKALAKLTNQERAQVKQVPTDFMLNPESPGHRLHKLKTKEDRFLSISVNMDLRIIVFRDKSTLIFCYVGHHDDAYDWANRRRIEVHPVTGAAQLVELEEIIREQVTYVRKEVEVPPIFASEADDYLLSLGVPNAWLKTVKQVDIDGLLEIVDRLPEEAGEALFKLVDGERPSPAARPNLNTDSDPFTHPDAQRRFWATSDELLLRQALDYPWDQWTIFLHPTQRDAVERNFGGPARISGSAGTGKTIVALHRAAYLAKKFDHAKILLTTYSRPLVASLEEGLNRLVGGKGDVRRRIKVAHLHKYAHEIVSDTTGFSFAPVGAEELDGYFDTALDDYAEFGCSKGFLRAEFDAIVDYWGIKGPSGYQRIERSGRGDALSLERRAEIWPIFANVLKQMRNAKRMTWSDLADAARQVIEPCRTPLFDAVVADEAQDFGPRELRFLMALAPIGPYSHFFTGDSNQRIYRYPFAWSRAGVDLRGRGATLVVNYRTTKQIRDFARTTLGKVKSNSEDEFVCGEAVSLLSGLSPVVERCEDPEDEINNLANWLVQLREQDFEPAEIAVFARTTRLLEERVIPALEKLSITANIVGGNRRPRANGIAIDTLHKAKGLEYRAVALVACDAEFLPHTSALAAADDDGGKEIAEARERQLFYVGCTRPREILRISYCGTPTKFLLINKS